MRTSLGQRVFSFPVVLGAILVGKACWTCRTRIVDPDLWWGLRNAQTLFRDHHLPAFDTYSFTAAGQPWLDHQWLSEVIYYGAYRALGLHGVYLVLAAAITLLSLGIFWLCLKETSDPLAAAVAAIFGGLLAMVGYTPRAQVFGWLCFLGIYGLLLRFHRTRRSPLWPIPLLFLLWINLHAGWPYGMVVFAILVVAGLVPRNLGAVVAAPWTPAELRRLLACFAASAVALLVNPFGYRLVLYPFKYVLVHSLNVAVGDEWSPVNFQDPRGAYVLALLAAIFVLALWARSAWRSEEVLLTAFLVYGGLMHIRLLTPAGIALPAILAPKLGRLSSYERGRERQALNAVLLAVIAAVIVLGFPSQALLRKQVDGFFPAAAVGYLKAQPPPGRMFNQFEWGGYLEWELPQTPTFIDTRADLFEDRGVLRDFLDVVLFRNSEEILDRYHIAFVLYPAGTPLSYLLSKSPHWKCVYSDPQAVIYQRTQDPR